VEGTSVYGNYPLLKWSRGLPRSRREGEPLGVWGSSLEFESITCPIFLPEIEKTGERAYTHGIIREGAN